MLEDHPLAQLFPTMNEKDFQELKTDIAEAGEVFIPIELYEGKVLDGRHRYRASTELGIECPMHKYTGTEPLKRIMSLNERRRHLSESQRAMVAAKIANMQRGGQETEDESVNLPIRISQPEAAQQLGVSTKSVGDAKVVLENGDDQLIADVETGKSSVSRAASDIRKQKFIERWGTPEEHEALQRGECTIDSIWGACKERQRLDVWLRTQRGEPQRQIASDLCISQGMVSKILQEARDLYGETEEEDDEEDYPEEKNCYVEGIHYPVTSSEAEDILLDQDAEDLEHQKSEDEGLVQPTLIPAIHTPESSEIPQEFIYYEANLDGYKRWLDVFAKHIALIGGLEDVGGMTTILGPLSHDKREHILHEMVSIRDGWTKHIDEAMSMMNRDLIPVGRTVLNGS